MNFYRIDILDLKTGEVREGVETLCGWTDGSAALYSTTMCDCNLGGCRDREIRTMPDGQRSIQAHEGAAYIWRQRYGSCDHSMPPKRLKVLRAHLQDGRVYDFEKGEFIQEAA